MLDASGVETFAHAVHVGGVLRQARTRVGMVKRGKAVANLSKDVLVYAPCQNTGGGEAALRPGALRDFRKGNVMGRHRTREALQDARVSAQSRLMQTLARRAETPVRCWSLRRRELTASHLCSPAIPRVAPARPSGRRPHARCRQRQAGDIAAHAIDRAAGLARTIARAGDNIKVAQVAAAKAEARYHRTRHGHVAAVASVGPEHRHSAAMRVGNPYGAVGRHLEAIRHAAGTHGGEGAPVVERTIAADIVDAHEPATG